MLAADLADLGAHSALKPEVRRTFSIIKLHNFQKLVSLDEK